MPEVTMVRARRAKRLRGREDLRHRPNGRGKGKWHSVRALLAYKVRAKKARKAAAASRRRNA